VRPCLEMYTCQKTNKKARQFVHIQSFEVVLSKLKLTRISLLDPIMFRFICLNLGPTFKIYVMKITPVAYIYNRQMAQMSFFAIWFEPTLPAVWLNLHAEKKSFRIVLSKTNVKRRNQVRFPKPSDPDVLPNISLDP